MHIPITTLPRVLPPQRDRAPQDTIPQTRDQREALRRAVSDYVDARRESIVPPLVLSLSKGAGTAFVRSAPSTSAFGLR